MLGNFDCREHKENIATMFAKTIKVTKFIFCSNKSIVNEFPSHSSPSTNDQSTFTKRTPNKLAEKIICGDCIPYRGKGTIGEIVKLR